MKRKQSEQKQKQVINPYVNAGSVEVYNKMQEVRRRRGYSKDLMVWEILVDLDEKLTEAEAKLEKLTGDISQRT